MADALPTVSIPSDLQSREARAARFRATAELGPVTLQELVDALGEAQEVYEGEAYDARPFQRLIGRLVVYGAEHLAPAMPVTADQLVAIAVERYADKVRAVLAAANAEAEMAAARERALTDSIADLQAIVGDVPVAEDEIRG